MHYYDRQGNPITTDQWLQIVGADMAPPHPYRRVARTNDVGGFDVSTVWLGIDHRFGGDGPPLIFETMVFPAGSLSEVDMVRYSTEAEAIAGHDQIVAAARDGHYLPDATNPYSAGETVGADPTSRPEDDEQGR